MREVDECVAYVAVVLQVDGQVEEVIGVLVKRVNTLQKHLLGVLVRDVLYHYCRSPIHALQDPLNVQLECLGSRTTL